MIEYPAEAETALLVISFILEVFGLLIIIYTCAKAIYRILRIEIFHEKRFAKYENVKRSLIQKIIFSLDFFVAADLIRLALLSDFLDIFKIAIIVAIRTVLAWSLGKEIHLHKEDYDENSK
jgi:uncharacterized membrane protein